MTDSYYPQEERGNDANTDVVISVGYPFRPDNTSEISYSDDILLNRILKTIIFQTSTLLFEQTTRDEFDIKYDDATGQIIQTFYHGVRSIRNFSAHDFIHAFRQAIEEVLVIQLPPLEYTRDVPHVTEGMGLYICSPAILNDYKEYDAKQHELRECHWIQIPSDTVTRVDFTVYAKEYTVHANRESILLLHRGTRKEIEREQRFLIIAPILSVRIDDVGSISIEPFSSTFPIITSMAQTSHAKVNWVDK